MMKQIKFQNGYMKNHIIWLHLQIIIYICIIMYNNIYGKAVIIKDTIYKFLQRADGW